LKWRLTNQVARMEYTSQREEAEMDMKTIEEPPRYEES
jgi:hypothetical protein